ncbi:DNA topoisomerase 3 [Lelliottia sp. V89_10]|uniref:type IA DNA topoisomerase n=1 Tax=Lelliottia wanjuensis TaxID=3050585 RepID=UPI00249DF004|nr:MULTISPECIES: type IA DNA topoisomerase [unclassified Lelliottia]MDI3360329.1 DNA topoisomerase 3 [Lelliottia sp. V89_13]MDK9549445.1 DNA topoisomerase 3 [Lelliottia sp. V89_5]MDK9596140.1 DNA topoisomerase 3 [Lelliottia sp. V89_10]
MRLFIAEKPSVAADIAKALGGNFIRKNGYFESSSAIVTNCIGHIIETQPPENYNPDYKAWSMNTLPLQLYPPKYQPKEATKGQVSTIIELLRRPDITEIVHAGDPDDEGQLLVDEVLSYAGNKKPVKRVLINDNTQPAVKKALTQLKDNSQFKGMMLKALARSVADEIYGYSLTRCYSILGREKGYKGVLSVGRVQTPVLGLVVRRYRENQSHTQSLYYSLTGNFISGTDTISARWKASEFAPVDSKKRLIDRKWADGLARTLAGKPASVLAAAVDTGKELAAPLPFNLLRLQQYVNQKHKITSQETMDITQVLKDTHKAITYNRSDCSYLPDDHHAAAPQLLDALQGLDMFSRLDLDSGRKSKAFNSKNVGAHHAIVPTGNIPDLSKLTEKERHVYLAIVIYYLAQFMPKKTFNEATAEIKCGEESFFVSARCVTHDGYTSLLGNDTESEEDGEPDNNPAFDLISRLRTGETLTCNDISIQENKTKPQPLYTESSLLAAMSRAADYVSDPEIKRLLKEKDKDKKDEHGGIGTPATRAAIIETLKKRNFITIEKGKIIPTETGIALIDALPPVAVNPDMTALWAEKQNAIEEGTLSVDAFIEQLYADIGGMIQNAGVDKIQINATPRQNDGQLNRLSAPCPNCGKDIIASAKLYACTGCDFKIWATVCGKKVSAPQAESLIKKGATGLIKGFISVKKETQFDAKLTLKNKATGELGFEFPPSEKS